MTKIGYINSKEDYLENDFERLNFSSSMISTEEKLDRLFYDEKITKSVSKLKSGIDVFRFYRRAIKEYIPDSEKINLYGGYSQRDIRRGKKYTILVDLEDDDNDKFWVWSSRQKQMKKISNEFTKSFIDKGMIKIVPGKKLIEKCKNMLERINNINIEKLGNQYSIDEFLCR